MLKKLITVAALVAVATPLAAVRAQDEGTIVEVAQGAGNFTTLVAAVEAAGLVETLSGEGPFTVFAPTDEAFAEIPQVALDYLLANPDVLARVLTYHVVAGEVPAADVVAATELTSVEGSPIAVSVDGETVQVNSATVTATDVEASNGVIHVIDRVIIPPVTLEEVDPLAAEGDIIVAGSSTVFPVAERLADMFNDAGFGGEITVESIGTGGGFERFCVNAETDVANASRAIREEEVAACVENGRTPVGFFIGIDALAVVVSSENDFLTDLSTEQLAQIFSGAVTTWDQVDPSFPAEEIRLFSPGSDSGTFDYFVEEIFDGDETQILNAAGIQLSEDDNVLVQGVEGSPYAIGYFGYAYYQENQDRLKSLSIDTVAPTAETAEAGEYPLSRPLYIYTAPEVVAEKPQVATFINYFLTNVNSVYGTGEGSIGYFPTSADNQNLDKVLFLAITAGE